MLISIPEAKKIINAVLVKHGYSEKEAEIIAEVILFASLRESSQGMNKLFGWHSEKDPQALAPEITQVTEVLLRCDAHRNSGIYANVLATEQLIDTVKKYGLGLVGVTNFNNSSGSLGYYTRRFSQQGLVGIMLASADPIGGIAPAGRKIGIFGTNPLAISVPHPEKDITLDMSTAKYTWGDLVKADIRGDELASGFAFDNTGQATTDPKKAMNGTVASFDGSYKGFGLAFMIQILAGALVGSLYEQSDEKCDYGSLLIGIDPARLGGLQFMQQQVSKMITALKEGSPEVFYPGEQSDSKYQKKLASNQVPIDEKLYLKIMEELN